MARDRAARASPPATSSPRSTRPRWSPRAAGDRLVAAARDRGADRWVAYFEPLPDRLRDDDVADLRKSAMRARAAYGPKDSVRDALPEEVTEPFLDAVDRLLKALAKRDVGG